MQKFRKPTDMLVTSAELFFIPVQTRVPLKFGTETLTTVTVARVKLTVRDEAGNSATGVGESPLSVQWGWPSATLSYQARHEAMQNHCGFFCESLLKYELTGHPVEVGYDFQHGLVEGLTNFLSSDNPALDKAIKENIPKEYLSSSDAITGIPHLASLLCLAPLDLALHDAYGRLHNLPVYETYNSQFMSRDLGSYFAWGSANTHKVNRMNTTFDFTGKYPSDFLIKPKSTSLRAWHLVGGLDPVEPSELKGDEPKDGYPVLLEDWIKTDGLKCLKIKLRGTDAAWDYNRIVQVGKLSLKTGVEWLTTDFNCTVTDPNYVNEILDRLRDEHPQIYGMLLYVEQPFPYDLEKNRIDVHSVSSRKPLFLDESAHDWTFVRLGRELGWSGVALKTCKTQTGALLSLCWAKAYGMTLMVQDLTNPMLAQVPHVLLAAHASTIMGVETNGMQFYPEASNPEAAIHPGLYKRRNGSVDFGTLSGAGFGYRLDEIARDLPPAAGKWELH